MKKILYSSFLCLLLLLSGTGLSFSQALPLLTVNGFISDSETGKPATNQEVFIATPGNIGVSLNVFTDSLGFYSALISPQTPQGYLMVYTYSCDKEVYKEIISYSSSANFSVNFSLCPSTTKVCEAGFYYTVNPSNPNLIRFYDISSSKHDIESTLWDFGDGTTSGLSNPDHLFNDSGSYQVSLHVITTDNCDAEFIDTLVIAEVAYDFCNANYYALLDTTTGLPNVFNFSDNSSASSPITQRFWNFDDGTSSTLTNPTHQFLNYSSSLDTFNVCLSIVTLTGCSSNYCYPFVVAPNASCNANFSYSPDLNSAKLITFQNQSQTISPIAYQNWDFGEGSQSSAINPQHTFPYPGFYTVRLEITTTDSCKSSFEKLLKVGNPGYYTLFGQVFSQTYPLIDTGIAYLYRSYPNNHLQAVDTMSFGNLGCYYFFQLIEGHYKISVRPLPASGFYQDLVPTYYSDKLHWNSAGHVVLTSNQYNADVHLQKIVANTGQGSIGGIVRSSPSAGIPVNVVGVMILLLNADGNPVRHTYSNSTGGFSFSGVSAGVYTIYAEAAGKYTLPVTVTLSQGSMVQTGVQLFINNTSITGISGQISMSPFIARAFPVPANNDLYVLIQSPHYQKVTLQLCGTKGEIFSQTQKMVGIGDSYLSLPISGLANGYYLIRVVANDSKEVVYLKVIKSEE